MCGVAQIAFPPHTIPEVSRTPSVKSNTIPSRSFLLTESPLLIHSFRNFTSFLLYSLPAGQYCRNMSPPSATEPHQNGDSKPSNAAPLEPGISETEASVQKTKIPGPPKFDDPYKERAYLKGRLAGNNIRMTKTINNSLLGSCFPYLWQIRIRRGSRRPYHAPRPGRSRDLLGEPVRRSVQSNQGIRPHSCK
jgi:hypothetical protein